MSVGDTFPTEFGNAFDGEILMKVFDEWGARGLAQAQFLLLAARPRGARGGGRGRSRR